MLFSCPAFCHKINASAVQLIEDCFDCCRRYIQHLCTFSAFLSRLWRCCMKVKLTVHHRRPPLLPPPVSRGPLFLWQHSVTSGYYGNWCWDCRLERLLFCTEVQCKCCVFLVAWCWSSGSPSRLLYRTSALLSSVLYIDCIASVIGPTLEQGYTWIVGLIGWMERCDMITVI